LSFHAFPDEVNQLRRFIPEWLHPSQGPKGAGARFFRAAPTEVAPCEPLRSELINKYADLIYCFLRYVLSIDADVLKELIYGVLSVQELPHADAGGAQAKTSTAIGIEENCPVVKLLPEHDARVGYPFLIIFHGSTLSRRMTLIEGAPGYAISVPRYHGVSYHSK